MTSWLGGSATPLIQNDGNMVLYNSSTSTWSSGGAYTISLTGASSLPPTKC